MQFLRGLWAAWKKLAHKIGNFQARLILTVFYIILIAPLALVMHFKDPLGIRHKSPEWHDKQVTEGSPIQRALQQF